MKLSLFKRTRRVGDAPAPKEPSTRARAVHPALPEAEELAVTLELEGSQPFAVDLYDMNIQRAEIRMPFHLAPLGGAGEVVRLHVAHPRDGWRVLAMGSVRRIDRWDDASVLVEVQFTALGDLYAQLDDALGRYFNRRSAARIAPDIDEKLPVKLAYRAHRMRGFAQDVSRTGLGVVLPLVQAAVFRNNERVRVHFELPGVDEPFEVPGVVKHGYRTGENVVLGVEFDLIADSPLRKRRSEFTAYVDARSSNLEAWQQNLSRRA